MSPTTQAVQSILHECMLEVEWNRFYENLVCEYFVFENFSFFRASHLELVKLCSFLGADLWA